VKIEDHTTRNVEHNSLPEALSVFHVSCCVVAFRGVVALTGHRTRRQRPRIFHIFLSSKDD